VPELVVNGAQLMCTFGVAPSPLTVLPSGPPLQAGGQLIARITDIAPMANIAPFGMCSAPSNPQVIAATSAAAGVFTPQPCIPATTSPWAPGSPKVTVGGVPAVTSTCRLTCMWGGQISVVQAGQVKVTG
jgi:Domain of unknown function (DUF4280)